MEVYFPWLLRFFESNFGNVTLTTGSYVIERLINWAMKGYKTFHTTLCSFAIFFLNYVSYLVLKAINEDVEKHSGIHRLLNVTSKSLLDYCENASLGVNASSVRKEVQGINQRYDRLRRVNFDVEKEAQIVHQNVGPYQKALEPVQKTIVQVESYLQSEPVIGLDVVKGKEELEIVEV